MPTIQSHLDTVTALDSELTTLQAALSGLRASYLGALVSASASPTAFQELGVSMRAKSDEIKAMVERIQRIFDHTQGNTGTIESAWYAGERYSG